MIINGFAFRWRKAAIKLFLLTAVCSASTAAISWVSTYFSIEHIPEDFPAVITFKVDELNNSQNLFFRPFKGAAKKKLNLQGAHTFSSTYSLPGYYQAQLSDQADMAVFKDVYVKSKGWMASLGSFDNPEYLDVVVNRQQRQIGLSSGAMFRVKSQAAHQPITFHYFDAFNPISSLDFNLEFEFKVFEESISPHPLSVIQIEGINGKYSTPIYSPSHYVEYPFIISNRPVQSDVAPILYGNPKSWNQFKMKVKDGYVIYRINERPEIKLPITASIGQIIGLRFSFNGASTFRNVTLTDTKEIVFVPTF